MKYIRKQIEEFSHDVSQRMIATMFHRYIPEIELNWSLLDESKNGGIYAWGLWFRIYVVCYLLRDANVYKSGGSISFADGVGAGVNHY